MKDFDLNVTNEMSLLTVKMPSPIGKITSQTIGALFEHQDIVIIDSLLGGRYDLIHGIFTGGFSSKDFVIVTDKCLIYKDDDVVLVKPLHTIINLKLVTQIGANNDESLPNRLLPRLHINFSDGSFLGVREAEFIPSTIWLDTTRVLKLQRLLYVHGLNL